MKVAVTVLFPFIVIVAGFVVPVQVLKTGLAVLQDLGAFWQKSNLTTRQQFQRFLFPEGMQLGSLVLEPVRPAVCPVVRVLQLWDRPENVTVVAAGGVEPSTLRV